MTFTKSALDACDGNEAEASILTTICDSAAEAACEYEISIGSRSFCIDATGCFTKIKG